MRQLCTHITYLNPFTMPRFSVPTGTGWHLSRFIQMIWQIQVKNPIFIIRLPVTLYNLLCTKALTIQCTIKPVHRCGTIDHHPVHVYKLYYRKSTLKHQLNTKMYLLRRTPLNTLPIKWFINSTNYINKRRHNNKSNNASNIINEYDD